MDREVVQMQFLYTGASTLALICLTAIAYFYIMNAISQVNEALIIAKMESKIAKTTALLTAALICSYRGRKIRKAVLELLGMRKPHASQLVAPRFVKANEQAALTMQLTMKKLVQLTMHMGRGVPRKAKKTNRLNLNSRHLDNKV